MSRVLERWNGVPVQEAMKQILPCCGSKTWAGGMAGRRPFPDVTTLLAASDETWGNLSTEDWMEAFLSHPRIGKSPAAEFTSVQSAAWSVEEQKNASAAGDAMKIALTEANQKYEERFRHIFIVCATGKSAPEILEILQLRLQNDDVTELHEAAEQQRQITRIRLTKWLSQ